MATAYTSAQLMQLGQAELVGTLDNDGVGAGNVDTGFNDRSSHQNIEASVIEVTHDLFECAFGHLPVAHADSRLGDQLGQIGCALFDGLHFVVQVVHLPATQQLAQYGFL